MPPHQTGHPVMGEIAPRRIAVFIGQAYPKSYIWGASFPLYTTWYKHSYRCLNTCLSYENGCSPRCNLTHNRVTRLVWWRTLTRHVKWNKIPSHTWLPYLTPNGVTHYNNTRIKVFYAFILVEYQLFTIPFFIKTMQKKNHGF